MKFYNSEQYQPNCNRLFDSYREQISRLLPDARVEHVGASSIPGAISKGDLDIFVAVEASMLEQCVCELKKLGFSEKIDTLRTDTLCMLESTGKEDVALQVVASGSEFECFLVFRDRLRAAPLLVKQYNKLKLSCEGWSEEAYRQKKSLFIEQVLER